MWMNVCEYVVFIYVSNWYHSYNMNIYSCIFISMSLSVSISNCLCPVGWSFLSAVISLSCILLGIAGSWVTVTLFLPTAICHSILLGGAATYLMTPGQDTQVEETEGIAASWWEVSSWDYRRNVWSLMVALSSVHINGGRWSGERGKNSAREEKLLFPVKTLVPWGPGCDWRMSHLWTRGYSSNSSHHKGRPLQ